MTTFAVAVVAVTAGGWLGVLLAKVVVGLIDLLTGGGDLDDEAAE